MADKQLSIPPGILEALKRETRKTLLEVLAETQLLDLQKCHEELQGVTHQLRDAAQQADVWRKIAELQGEKIDTLNAKVDDLEDDNVRRHAEIVALMAELGKVSRKP